MGASFARFPIDISLPRLLERVGFRITRFEACSAFTHVRACILAEPPTGPLHRRLQPFRYLHDCSDCYRLERQLAGWDSHPLEDRAFARHTEHAVIGWGARQPNFLRVNSSVLRSHPALRNCDSASCSRIRLSLCHMDPFLAHSPPQGYPVERAPFFRSRTQTSTFKHMA